MATVVAGRLRGFVDPAHPRRDGRVLEEGTRVLIVDEMARGEERLFQLNIAQFWGDLAWYPATHQSGNPTLSPLALQCPDPNVPITGPAIGRFALSEGLACYGNREITLAGEIYCYSAIGDGGPGGAPWIDAHRFCQMDGVLVLFGEPVTSLIVDEYEDVRGSFDVAGHFDDPASRGCSWRPIGVDVIQPQFPGEPSAVIMCRQMFVVTSVEPAPSS
jgi:hypothetical protein